MDYQPAITIETIKSHADAVMNGATGKTRDSTGQGLDGGDLFDLRPANDWINEARTRPMPKMLFGPFWFEGEISILFSDANRGKSILAVQIADAIARGQSIDDLLVETDAQKVIYFDFELSDKQFELRYAEKDGLREYLVNHYRFSENLYRAEINVDHDDDHGFETFEDYLIECFADRIRQTGARVLIIDNLTYLRAETEKAKDALPLMKYLKKLKKRFGLSILVLAHTPKRDASRPLTQNDLAGSKMIFNFCDSAFAIGESARDQGLRYLKQIKARNTEVIYHTENVYLCEIQKPTNFLHFKFLDCSIESDHLRSLTTSDKTEIVAQVKHLRAGGLSQRAIADKLGISAMTVNRYLQRPD